LVNEWISPKTEGNSEKTQGVVMGDGLPRSSIYSGSKPLFAGLFILTALIGAALFAAWLAPFSPTEINLEESLRPPDKTHLFGQDRLGRDVLSRILFGARVSVLVGFSTVGISLILGTFLG